MTYKFRPDLEKKIKGVKKKFMNNLTSDSKKYGLNPQLRFQSLNRASPDDFVLSAFDWGATPEGFEFWVKISDR